MSTNNPEDLSEPIMDLTKSNSAEVISVEPPSQTPLSSPKSSTESKKSPGDANSKNRRKRKPKKVSTSQNEASDTEGNEPMDIDLELTNKVSSHSVITINSESSKPESDCETIEKIAKMVSNITSDTNKTESQSTPQELINEVENRLEEMFAEEAKGAAQGNEMGEKNSVEVLPPQENGTAKEKPKVAVKPKARKKKIDGNTKKQKKNMNGGKLKDNKKNDKTGKLKADKSKQEKQDAKKSKVKSDAAPYLQISKDGSFTIVNQTINGDDDSDKPSNKQKKPVTTEKHRHRGLHVSTLSSKYDADKRDASWICVFCKLGPHKFKLGDLFGPYIVNKNSPEYSLCLEDPANDIFRQSNKDKFSPIKSPPNTPKKKRKNSEGNKKVITSPAVNGPEVNDEVFTGMTAVDENNYEIWFHEDCIVWAPGTHIIGTKIIGLEAAVWQSTRHRCGYCSKNGAMIACLTRGCSKEAHIICARQNWKLCEDFKTYCDQHV